MVSTDRPEEVPAAWRWLLDDKLDTSVLPDDIALMIDLVGREAVAKLLGTFNGLQVYFPNLKTARGKYRENEIRAAFDGSNHRALARKYGLSVHRIYDILKATPAGQK